jgi:hypothetical protein
MRSAIIPNRLIHAPNFWKNSGRNFPKFRTLHLLLRTSKVLDQVHTLIKTRNLVRISVEHPRVLAAREQATTDGPLCRL